MTIRWTYDEDTKHYRGTGKLVWDLWREIEGGRWALEGQLRALEHFDTQDEARREAETFERFHRA